MSYLLPRNALMIKNFLLLEVEPRHISAPELNQIPNMARSGFPACHCLSGKYSRQYRYNHYSG